MVCSHSRPFERSPSTGECLHDLHVKTQCQQMSTDPACPFRKPPTGTATASWFCASRAAFRDYRGYVTSATTREQTPGYILTRFAGKYGREVATAFAGGRALRPRGRRQQHLPRSRGAGPIGEL